MTDERKGEENLHDSDESVLSSTPLEAIPPEDNAQSPPADYAPLATNNTSTVVNSAPLYAHKYVETERDGESGKLLMTVGNSLPRTSIDGSFINLHATRKGFLLKFYKISTLQGRVSYFLMSIYVINAAVYDSWFGGTVLYPYLLANMVYGYTFVIFTRIHFMTMSPLPRIFWSFLGSMMFSFASCVTFQWVADNWAGKSAQSHVLTATILSVLYGRMYAGALISYFNHVDKKILSLVRRINEPYIFDS